MRSLSMEEVAMVSGGDGINWSQIGAGVGIIALGVALAASGGLAAIPISVFLGAATAGELAIGAVAVGAAAVGGVSIGNAASTAATPLVPKHAGS